MGGYVFRSVMKSGLQRNYVLRGNNEFTKWWDRKI